MRLGHTVQHVVNLVGDAALLRHMLLHHFQRLDEVCIAVADRQRWRLQPSFLEPLQQALPTIRRSRVRPDHPQQDALALDSDAVRPQRRFGLRLARALS